jgi:hypothetical protein
MDGTRRYSRLYIREQYVFVGRLVLAGGTLGRSIEKIAWDIV